jgi:hypothetical protein
MKRKLRLEDLTVDTFATTPAAPLGRGTVRGREETDACYASAGGVCVEDSVEVTCGLPSCGCETMGADACVYFCEVTQPRFFTCGATCGFNGEYECA